jgi:hypothetical protein
MTQQLTPNQKQWITALRSGGYTQGTACLHSSNGFCCLGVAAKEFLTDDVVVAEHSICSVSAKQMWSYDDETDMAPEHVMKALGLYDEQGTSRTRLNSMMLIDMNDKGKTFDQIADIIEDNPENYFREDHTL